MKPSGHPEDNHSDTSRETVTSDSGRGGSEDDLPVSHNNSKGKHSEEQIALPTRHSQQLPFAFSSAYIL